MVEINWEAEIAGLLGRLGATQEKLLQLFTRKRELLLQRDHQGLTALVTEETALVTELEACQEQRQALLVQAAAAGLPADSIASLADALPSEDDGTMSQSLAEATKRSHLLRHQSVAQWVVVQRTLLHLSHMLEIIATGGQLQPTYGTGKQTGTSGALMDQAV